MKVINLNKFKSLKDFPPIKIPEDGTDIGIEQLKNIIDLTFKATLEAKNIQSLKGKGWLKKLFGGYIRFAVFLLDTSVDIYESVPILAKEVKDLDFAEINELVLYLAKKYEINQHLAQNIFDLFRKVVKLAEDGVITFAELAKINDV